MELISYLEETKEVVFKCDICSNITSLEVENSSAFKSLNAYLCILNDGEEVVCEQCGNVHNSDKPLVRSNEPDQIRCPKCRSTQIQLMKRGWKITTGFIGSSKNERVCLSCKHKF